MLLGAIAGCQGQGPREARTPLPQPHLEAGSIVLNVAEGVNDGWPVEVALVRVPTVEAMDELLQIDSRSWFGGAGPDFRLRNADARVDAWEVAPGTSAGPFDLRRRGKFGGVLFCNVGSGSPTRFEQNGDAFLFVDDQGCTVTGECEPVSAWSRLLRVPLPAGACSKRVRPVWTRSLTLVADEYLNENWPVRIDMVRVEHANELDLLLGFSAREWFESESEEFRRTHPGARYDTWEVVPGTEVGPVNVRVRGRSLAGVVFCDTPAATGPVDLVEGNMMLSVHDTGCIARKREGSTPLDRLRRIRFGWPSWLTLPW